MLKSTKCLLVLIAGLAIMLVAGWMTDYWANHFIFAGPIVLLGTVISAVISNHEEHRKLGALIMFWAGFTGLLVYTLIYTEPGTTHPENWGVILTCFIVGAGSSQLVYYIETVTRHEKHIQQHLGATINRRV